MPISCWGGVVQEDACPSCNAIDDFLFGAAKVYPIGVGFQSCPAGVGGLVFFNVHFGDVSMAVATGLPEEAVIYQGDGEISW